MAISDRSGLKRAMQWIANRHWHDCEVTAGRIEKMSKSKRNVVDPELIIQKLWRRYGAVIYACPTRHQNVIWNGPNPALRGRHGFLKRVWRMAQDDRACPPWYAVSHCTTGRGQRARTYADGA